MILIYAPQQENDRLKYVCEFIFRETYKAEYKLSSSKEEAFSHDGLVINYSKEEISHSFSVFPQGAVVFDSTIDSIEITPFFNGKIPAFFKTPSGNWPFDVFATCFYLLSRYEEYLPFTADVHGRYLPENSILYQMDCLGEPVIDIWLADFFTSLQDFYPSLQIKKPVFTFISTLDVDNAFAFRHKNLIRSIQGSLRDLITGRISWFFKRWRCLIFGDLDPYDTFDFIQDVHNEYSLKPDVFFLYAGSGKYDRGILPENKAFKKLIRLTSGYARVGLHASYESNYRNSLKDEKQMLEEAAGEKILSNRQHFLKLNLPATYRSLIQAGITEDYSMGYSTMPAFRAGTSMPFYFYDLSAEMQTSLRIFPFSLMDRTLMDHLNLSPLQAKDYISSLLEKIALVNGTFVSLWHNESLSGYKEWAGWREVYLSMIQKATDIGNLLPEK